MRKRKRQLWIIPTLAVAVCIISAGCMSTAPYTPGPVDYATPKALLDPYKGTVTQVVALLEQQKGDDAKALLDELQSAVTEANAVLTGTHFTGSADALSDPFTLPAGAYRVHLLTPGFFAAKAIPVSDPTTYDRLFNLGSGEATNGASVLYVSDGSRIMVEISNVSEPYEMWFEKVE